MLVANFGSSTSAAFKPSMLLDFEAHKPLELEAIIGSLISRGKAKNAPTSRLGASYDSLIGYQMFTLQAMRNGV